jgi:adenine C2-methylase RlmN of 23S rRNA A2503 and tRNA A37
MKEADLNNAFKYDKIILNIDAKSCLTTNPSNASYYIDLLEPLRNVVYMGMGEPMLNYENVKQSIIMATDQKKIGLANRRMTVSTCGIVP